MKICWIFIVLILKTTARHPKPKPQPQPPHLIPPVTEFSSVDAPRKSDDPTKLTDNDTKSKPSLEDRVNRIENVLMNLTNQMDMMKNEIGQICTKCKANTTDDPGTILEQPSQNIDCFNDVWYIRLYNADDILTAYVNDKSVANVSLNGDSGFVDVTSYIENGSNNFTFWVYNAVNQYTWGFQIKRNDTIVFKDEAGVRGNLSVIGADNRNRSRTHQYVHNNTVFFNVTRCPTVDATTTAATPSQTSPTVTCVPECQNNGTCTDRNTCECPSGYTGPTCEIQSVGLCQDNETIGNTPILLITFGNGVPQYSQATPAHFSFSTTYRQKFEPVTDDGSFSFVNALHGDYDEAWHTNATDHTGDDGGYMLLVNADHNPGQFYNGTVRNLCVGLRYEFSVYLANVLKPIDGVQPNVRFEVRSATSDNRLLAKLSSGEIPEEETLTWNKYGLSFIAPSSTVVLLMIDDNPGGRGNDIVIDDIALNVCAHEGADFCPVRPVPIDPTESDEVDHI